MMRSHAVLDSPAAQQPEWPDPCALRDVVDELAGQPPLVSPRECDRLLAKLASVAAGEAFLIQGGDCAETFAEAVPATYGGKVRVLRQMAEVLGASMRLPVVTVGRIAGQYGKPRSSATETRGGTVLPSYRGDAVNGMDFSAQERTPDPRRLLQAYRAASDTLMWLRDFAGEEFFTSHEALLLPYEMGLSRTDFLTGRRFGSSGHMLWIGERTRSLDGAHVEFAAGVCNPIGVKLGPTASPADVLALIERLDPDRQPGRITLITRMSAGKIRDVLPPLVEEVTASAPAVTWVCDPMHGNTFSSPSGYKTRRFDDVLDEVVGFFEVHRALGTHPGGLHLELTGEPVTECVGGSPPVTMESLGQRYETACDPRLNRDQALKLAAAVGKLTRS
ncbi:3-deoxy-7-phosphoheptulonate synthase class II [Saccharopolyspora shandongensis]|uniref:3-deoxy-7-phosphoheptulonate synthase class II n=1 Tax=Saccharopolyspora shandongensis TaxID=418495 RepID=UPI0033C5EC1B